MAANPPVEFSQYMKWRTSTSEGRRWWREAVAKHHTLYKCDQCGDELWLSSDIAERIPCPWPCGGTKRKQREKQIWEGDDGQGRSD